jgi:hypothetical protein
MSDRTTLAKSNREDRDTFYLLTMDASLSRIVRMGDEMTEEEVRASFVRHWSERAYRWELELSPRT